MESRTRELDLRRYREQGKRLPKNFSFRFRPQVQHVMYYGANVDLNSLKRLGALTAIYRTTFYLGTDLSTDVYRTQHQYTVEFALPVDSPLVLGKVSTLSVGDTNAVNFA